MHDNSSQSRPTWAAACDLSFSGNIQRDQNDERAARITLAIVPAYEGCTLEDAAQYALADLRHLCDMMGFAFHEIDRDAHGMYLREIHDCGGVAKNNALKEALEQDLTDD